MTFSFRIKSAQLRAILVVLVLVLSALAMAQKGGRRSSSSSKSKSSHSSSKSGAVHVKGYFRKDGTYVQPHYRSRPDGIVSNNWSFKGNVNPFTGKVGTKGYPLGVWVDPADRKRTFNTPFLGINADFENTTSVKVGSSTHSLIKAGSVITHHRGSNSSTYLPVESWHDLSAKAMESDTATWWVKGVDAKGKPFESKVSVLGAEHWSGSYDLEPKDGHLFKGIEPDPNAEEARISMAGQDYQNLVGCKIVGVRKVSESTFTDVAKWGDIERLVKVWGEKEVVIKGVDSKGDSFSCVVTVNKP